MDRRDGRGRYYHGEDVELETLLPQYPTREEDGATHAPNSRRSSSATYARILNRLTPPSSARTHRPWAQARRHPRRASESKFFSFPHFRRPFAHLIPRSLRFRSRTLLLLVLWALTWTPIILLALVLAYGGVPPDYSAVRKWERELPQHVWHRSKVLGGSTSAKLARRTKITQNEEDGDEEEVDDGRRYLRFPDHLWGHGLNNVLQEALLTSYLSHRANRSFVFEDFTWSHLPLPYTLYDFALRPTRVPLGAFVGGWVVGGGGRVASRVARQDSNKIRRSRTGDKASGLGEGQTVKNMRSSAASTPTDTIDADPVALSTSTPTTALSFLRRTLLRAREVLGVFGDEATSDDTRRAIEERRAVSAEYFEYVCPPGRRVEIWYGRDQKPKDDQNESVDEDESLENRRSTESTPMTPPADDASGVEIIEWWIRRLQQPDVLDEPCVVIREEEKRVFDSHFFGSTRILPLFDDIKQSPVLQGFSWSPLVQSALDRSVGRFFSTNSTSTPPAADGSSISSSPVPVPPPSSSLHTPPIIPGLLAVHLRRGDYKRHCLRLAEWRAGYMGFNRFDGMVDTFDADEHLRTFANTNATAGESHSGEEEDVSRRALVIEEERERYYLKHCLPTIQEIVQRLHAVREDYQRTHNGEPGQQSAGYALHDVYVLTNGWPAFVAELREALLADGWRRVMGTPQLEDVNAFDGADASPPPSPSAHQDVLSSTADAGNQRPTSPVNVESEGLTREEKGVSVAVDMGFAERAEVFVGNGFSSLSSNIVMLRMARGMPVYSSRLL